MNKESSLSRPTFKRTLRRISIISVLLTMTLIWLLICVASVLTFKQYAQKNLDLTAATMTHSLEAALVFSDNAAAAETLATLGRQGQFSAAEVRDKNGRIIASWRYDARAADDKLIGLISHWLFHCQYRNQSGTTAGPSAKCGLSPATTLLVILSGYRWQC